MVCYGPFENACRKGDLTTVSFSWIRPQLWEEKDPCGAFKPLILLVRRTITKSPSYCSHTGQILMHRTVLLFCFVFSFFPYTALMVAAGAGSIKTVRLLLDRKADIHLRDSDGRTVPDLAKGPRTKTSPNVPR